ncbi:arylsulfatase [Botrimarina sp.]|uniref:sulfatase family protein n=1 Tax=Botrimarina sp. TaxID=2795802 RepID=UPI0032EFF5AD
MFRLTIAYVTAAATACACLAADRPNIVLIYADDVGYGDVSCYGQQTLPTPNIDRLAAEGLRFTDAHASAATCTPSRYAMLTGQYAFRRQDTGIRSGASNLIIDPATATLPGRLRSVGYDTAVVGKWHLGLGDGPIDWNGSIHPGPEAVGFGYHFLIPATGDRTPCVYVEQGRVVGLDPDDPIQVSYDHPVGDDPTGRERPDLLKQQTTHGHDQTVVNGISRIGYMSGGHSARWVDEDMADVITSKAIEFIERRRDAPFFLFFSTHDVHVPRVPHARFVGATGLGPRGDAMAQLDWCVGEVLRRLDELGLADSTLVVFTSDNGPVLDDGYADRANEQLGRHTPAGPFRGGKYSKFEGGTRVPLLVRWPGHAPAGEVSPALFGQVDLAATLATLVGADIPEGAFTDSRNELDAFLGEDRSGRPFLVHEANGLALRKGDWKYVSPGPTRERLGPWTTANIGDRGALFHLGEDPSEATDLSQRYPEVAAELRQLLAAIVDAPGPETSRASQR